MNGTTTAGKRCAAEASVIRRATPCAEHVLLELAARDFPSSMPGQFLQLLCRADSARPASVCEWPPDGFPSIKDASFAQREAYLRRPLSIADRWTTPDGVAHLCVVSRAVGVGTQWLEGLRVGDTVSVTGPLGRGFRAAERDEPVVLVGGGVGIPPLLYLTRSLHESGHRDVTVIFGATTRDLLPVQLGQEPARDGVPRVCVDLPGQAAYRAAITSDDGTIGLPGVVTDALQRWHESRSPLKRGGTVYACGPDGMLRAVALLTRELGLDCQLCIERQMGCGVGTCLSCVVRLRAPDQPEGWRWGLTCSDGPVFERDDLLDYMGGDSA